MRGLPAWSTVKGCTEEEYSITHFGRRQKMRACFSADVPLTRRACKREAFCSHTSDCLGSPHKAEMAAPWPGDGK